MLTQKIKKHELKRDKAIKSIYEELGKDVIIHDWSSPSNTKEDAMISFCVLLANEWEWNDRYKHEDAVSFFIPCRVFDFEGGVVLGHGGFCDDLRYELLMFKNFIDKDILANGDLYEGGINRVRLTKLIRNDLNPYCSFQLKSLGYAECYNVMYQQAWDILCDVYQDDE